MNEKPIEVCINCSRCKITPEEYLQMDCHHHICLECSKEELEIAQVLLQKSIANDLHSEIDISLNCDTCNGATKLHEKTISYIMNYMPKKIGDDQITEVDINQEITDKAETTEKPIDSDSTSIIKEDNDDKIMISNDNVFSSKKKLIINKNGSKQHLHNAETQNKQTGKSVEVSQNSDKKNVRNLESPKKKDSADDYNDTRRNIYRDSYNNNPKKTKKGKTTQLSAVNKMGDKKLSKRNTMNYFKGQPKSSTKGDKETSKPVSRKGPDREISKAGSRSIKSDNDSMLKATGSKLSGTRAFATKGSKTYTMGKTKKDGSEMSNGRKKPEINIPSRKISKREGEMEEPKSVQSSILRKSRMPDKYSNVRDCSKSIGNSNSPTRKSNLNNKQQMLLDAIKMNTDIDFDLVSSKKKSNSPKKIAPKKIAPEKIIVESLTFEAFLEKIDELLLKCNKFSSGKPLIENKLQQNYWMVVNATKEAYRNFSKYIRIKENETLQVLETSYYQNLKEYQDEEINCSLLAEKFKLVGEGMREISRFNTSEEKKWFEETNVPKLNDELLIDGKAIPNMELIKIIQERFFESNNQTINQLNDIDKQIKTALQLPEKLNDMKSNATVASFIFGDVTSNKNLLKEHESEQEAIKRDSIVTSKTQHKNNFSGSALDQMFNEKSPRSNNNFAKNNLIASQIKDYAVDYNVFNDKLNEARRTIFGKEYAPALETTMPNNRRFDYENAWNSNYSSIQLYEKEKNNDIFSYRTPEKSYAYIKPTMYHAKSNNILRIPNNKVSRLLETQGMNFQSKTNLYNSSRTNNFH